MTGESNFLQAMGWAVLNSLWQMALLWVTFQFIISAFKLKRPSHKSSLASVILITGFTWFIYTFISIWSDSSAANSLISSDVISVNGNEKLNSWLRTTLPVASVLYLVLLILPLLHFFRNYRYVQLIRKEGLSKMDVQWRIFVKKVAAQMGIKKPVHIWISELVTSPVTIGYLKPVILVPLAAINHLTTQQLEAVLLHELSHIRRYDYIVNLIINFIQTILYFNPFVKALVKTVEREREKSCDEMVMQFQYDPHGYASALLILEKANHISRPLAVAASGKKNDLLNRVEFILGIRKKPFVSFNRLAGLFAGLLCVIALNALVIFSKPINNTKPVSLTHLSSPFFFFTGDNSSSSQPVIVEEKKTPVVSHPQEPVAKIERANTTAQHFTPDERIYINAPTPTFVNVKYTPVIDAPQLKSYEEAQIKQTLDASKRVLEEGQWKAVEKNIADALTSNVKGKLKAEYLKEFNKIDLKKWGDKLRSAYDQIDWDRINEQLGKAVCDIRLDSLQNVYVIAENQLTSLQQQLTDNDLKGIPDSDITLQSLEEKKHQVQKVLNNIKAVRTKKIIRL